MLNTCNLDQSIADLRRDFLSGSGISAQSGIPFAILRYSPNEEFTARRKLRLLGHEMEEAEKRVAFISIAELTWKAVEETDGLDYLFKTEQIAGGVMSAQRDIGVRLRPGKPFNLAEQIRDHISDRTTTPDIVFLVRLGGLAPHIYPCSSLLHELHQIGYNLPTILCYPGSSTIGTDLSFYDLSSGNGLGTYNYRVKIYGTN